MPLSTVAHSRARAFLLTRCNSKVLAALILIVAATTSTRALAQGALPVLPSTQVHLAIERLSALGLVRASVAQLPVTRGYLRLVAAQARRGADSLDALARDATLSEDRRALARQHAADARADAATIALAGHLAESSVNQTRTVAAAPVERIDLELLAADARARAIPFNGLSAVDAQVNPIADYRMGRQPLGRSTGFLTLTGWAGTDRLALLAEPRFGVGAGDGSTSSQAAMQRLLLGGQLGNASIVVGRDYLKWGQGVETGMFVSANPGPVDQVRLSTARPVRLPWLFRYAGDVSGTIFVARLGEDYYYPNAHLLGYKLTLMPTRRLELGASYFNIAGGRGAPSPPVWKRVVDNIALINLFINDTTLAFSNKLSGLEARYTLPWRSSQLYLEWDLDDFDWRRPASSFWNHDAGALFGVFLPSAPAIGADTHLEYHHTGARFYQHGEWISGATLHHRMLGEALGPDANGGYLRFDWRRNPLRATSLQFAFEERSNDQYRQVGDTVHTPHIFKTARRPRERHARVSLQTARSIHTDRLFIEAGGAYDRVTNFDFVNRPALSQFLLRLGIVYRVQ